MAFAQSSQGQKAVVLTFDDDWPGQYKYAKPILEKYGANATFFISCTTGDSFVREQGDPFMMTWDEVRQLHDWGFDLQSHGLTHADLTKIPLDQAEDEISLSKVCIEGNVPGLNITWYANAYAAGGDVKEIVDIVSRYYDFARSGYSNTTYLDCDGWYVEDLREEPGCSLYTENGTLKYAHKYSMFASSHNNIDKVYEHNNTKILQDFEHFLNREIILNDTDGSIVALPIIAYHNVAHLYETPLNWWNSTTTPTTLEAEVKYMHDNGIRMLSISDLVYDNVTERFHIRP